MSVWFTSDLHIGHRLIAGLRGFCPTTDGTEAAFEEGIRVHDRALADNWDELIHHDDEVWILGDLSAGGKRATNDALEWVAERPGRKHLISGNHDPIHPMHRDSHKWNDTYQRVFNSAQPFARRRIGGKEVLMSHFPYSGDHTESDRFDQYRLRDRGIPLLHGHVHSVSRFPVSFQQIHVGVDAWDLRPIHLDEIAEYLKSCSD